MVGYVRRNLFVPLPSFQSFDALNAYLDAQCRKRLELERETMIKLPQTPYDASDKQTGRRIPLAALHQRSYLGNVGLHILRWIRMHELLTNSHSDHSEKPTKAGLPSRDLALSY